MTWLDGEAFELQWTDVSEMEINHSHKIIDQLQVIEYCIMLS